MIDRVLWDDWHVVAESDWLRAGEALETTLLEVPLAISRKGQETAVVRIDGAPLHQALRYGFVWVCLGTPARDIVDIPEFSEPGRCIVTGGSFGVHVAGPRVIENFLDLGHLGYVHAGYLGAEPDTAVPPYEVRPLPEGGIIATGCKVFQPRSSPAATDGFVVDYVYKVLRPLTTCLYKANPVDPARDDVIYLFVQPVDEEHSRAHMLVLFLEESTDASELRWFQQLIFLQDKPIVENQRPKRLPIGPGMEMPILADKSSVAYRRWLLELGLRYGTIGVPDRVPA